MSDKRAAFARESSESTLIPLTQPVVALAAEYVPTAQLSQDDACAPEYLPASHHAHADDIGRACFPGSQLKQPGANTELDAYWPVTQLDTGQANDAEAQEDGALNKLVQLTAPQHEYRPTSQLTHDPLMRSEGRNAEVQPRHLR